MAPSGYCGVRNSENPQIATVRGDTDIDLRLMIGAGVHQKLKQVSEVLRDKRLTETLLG